MIEAIPGYVGYFAATDGRILSRWRRVGHGNGGGCHYTPDGPLHELVRGKATKKGKVVSTYVRLKLGSAIVNKNVHNLILETFVGPCPAGMLGCHNDGNAENNQLANLRWGTPKSNSADRWLHGTMRFGSSHQNAVIDETVAQKIKSLLASGWSCPAVAAKLNASVHIVKDIKRGRTWIHV